MNVEVRKNILNLQGFYLLSFFGVGSLFPLLSVYLSEVEKLNGYEIGTILSIGPIIMIFFQPIWGMISDATNSPIKVLTFTTGLAGILGLTLIWSTGYAYFLAISIAIAIFQSAIIPVSDSISLKYTSKNGINYGNVRLFGSLGFGIAVFVMGRLSEWNPQVIFWSFFVTLAAASLFALKLPKENVEKKGKLLSGMKELFKLKKFIVFLIVTFLIFGPNLANNFYFGLFVEEQGGTYTGIGIAFLIAVLSEIPFMRIAGKWIAKFGLLQVAALAGTVSLIRWLLYFTEPSLSVVYGSAVIQGFSLGLFIPAGIQYIREVTPLNITATAVTVYSAIGNGLGNWFSTFFAGILYEEYSVYMVYLFFAALALIGVSLCIWLIKEEKQESMISGMKMTS